MRTRALLPLAVVLALTAGALPAQEPAAEDADERPQPANQIKVLNHPYDLASFYRNDGPAFGSYGSYGGSTFGTDRYPIASFYRQRPSRSGFGYGQFWTSGYGYGYGRGRSLRLPFRRSIGENGDLFLLAPTVLAPIGPLTSVFVEPR